MPVLLALVPTAVTVPALVSMVTLPVGVVATTPRPAPPDWKTSPVVTLRRPPAAPLAMASIPSCAPVAVTLPALESMLISSVAPGWATAAVLISLMPEPFAPETAPLVVMTSTPPVSVTVMPMVPPATTPVLEMFTPTPAPLAVVAVLTTLMPSPAAPLPEFEATPLTEIDTWPASAPVSETLTPTPLSAVIAPATVTLTVCAPDAPV